MAVEEIAELREKYLSYLQPERYFDVGTRVKPNVLKRGYRKSHFSKLQQRNYNQGKAYVSSSGIIKPPRATIFKKCSCPLRCWQKFNEVQLARCFEEFWEMGSVEKRRNFILRYCAVTGNERRHSYFYSLPHKLLSINNKTVGNVAVCRRFFCSTLDITFRFISWTLLYKDSNFGSHCKPDGRGGRKKNCLSEEQFQDIVKTFAGERIQPSHYGRKDSKKVYFESSKSVAYFFKKYDENKDGSPSKVKYDTFLKTVRATFPELSFVRCVLQFSFFNIYRLLFILYTIVKHGTNVIAAGFI